MYSNFMSNAVTTRPNCHQHELSIVIELSTFNHMYWWFQLNYCISTCTGSPFFHTNASVIASHTNLTSSPIQLCGISNSNLNQCVLHLSTQNLNAHLFTHYFAWMTSSLCSKAICTKWQHSSFLERPACTGIIMSHVHIFLTHSCTSRQYQK